MDFRDNEAIYMQIANNISERILLGKWKSEDKIPSVRDLAIEMEVNPNTVIRTYEFLQSLDIIYTKRGLGFFVTGEAVSKIKKNKKDRFMQTELPEFFKSIYLLEIKLDEVEKRYQDFKSKYSTNNYENK